MSEAVEKDNFWLYLGIGVLVFVGVIFAVWNAEHGKYQQAESLIAENPVNSAYLNKTKNN